MKLELKQMHANGVPMDELRQHAAQRKAAIESALQKFKLLDEQLSNEDADLQRREGIRQAAQVSPAVTPVVVPVAAPVAAPVLPQSKSMEAITNILRDDGVPTSAPPQRPVPQLAKTSKPIFPKIDPVPLPAIPEELLHSSLSWCRMCLQTFTGGEAFVVALGSNWHVDCFGCMARLYLFNLHD